MYHPAVEGPIRFVAENSHVPVIKHYKEVYNLFVDASADLKMAGNRGIIVWTPGRVQCDYNLVVESSIAEEFLRVAKQ